MGMGAMSAFADVIPIESLRQFLPLDFLALEQRLKDWQLPWDVITSEKDDDQCVEAIIEHWIGNIATVELCDGLDLGPHVRQVLEDWDDPEACKTLLAPYAGQVLVLRRCFVEAFDRLTRVPCDLPADGTTALGLAIYTHDSDAVGGRYDEVDGVYFAVDNLYRLSEPGREWQEKLNIERRFFVTYG